MADDFKSYKEALNWLMYELPKTNKEVFRGPKGMRRVKKLLAALGNPQDDCKTVHIAASSGKGTVAMLTTQLLLANGRSVGTMMSPHVYDFRERFLVDGELCGCKESLAALNKVKDVVLQLREGGVYSTFYEAVLAIGYTVFSEHGLDYIVLETGVGGRLDGSNCITRDDKVSILGQIGLDHTDILGETLSEIADEKAGIILDDSMVIALRQSTEVNNRFEVVAAEHRARLELLDGESYKNEQPFELVSLNTSLVGQHSYDNLALAVAAAEYVARRDGWEFKAKSVEEAITNFRLPGRLEVINFFGKQIILDGAHSEQKLTALVNSLQAIAVDEKFSIVFACAQARNPEELITILQPIAKEYIFTGYNALKSDMKRRAHDFTGYQADGAPSETLENGRQVVQHISESDSTNWLVTGSFFVVSEIGELLHDED